jgi:hypothetical protein
MIISDRYRFVFVHIPKCAGTYARKRLEPYDDTGGHFTGRVEQHPAVGLMDYVHIPLRVLQQHFQSEIDRLNTYRTFAVVRDPFDRFPSSIAQRLKTYKGRPIHAMSRHELHKETEAAIDYLSQHDAITDPAYIHLARQSDYLELNGTRIVKHIYVVDDVDVMLNDISKLTGTELVEQNQAAPLNQTVVYRNKRVRLTIQALRPILGGLISTMLPERAKSHIRRVAYVPRTQNTPDIFKSDVITSFIRDYYRRDGELYELAKCRDQTSATGS